MAASHFSSGGFSYAQAARGQTSSAASQIPSSKGTSGAVSPANGVPQEPAAKTNWADDVEASMPVKSDDPPKPQPDSQQKSAPTLEAAEVRSKSEDKPVNGVSGTHSPDLITTPSTAPREDDLLSAVNGSSSESAWESRSQASEPAWIADRKERQTRSQSREQPSKVESNTKASTPQQPDKMWVLQDAAPPTVNPWLKRAEEAKAKAVSVPRPTATTPSSSAPIAKENLPPRADNRRKANSVATISAEAVPVDTNSRRKPADTRDGQHDAATSMDPPPKPLSSTTTAAKPTNGSSSYSARKAPPGRQSLSAISSAPPLVSDESSWPTPDTTLEKERKDSSEKDADEKREEDGNSASKGKKREWKVLPVTPNFLFQTSGINEPKGRTPRASVNGERGGKSSSGGRGRGGHRGASHGAGGDRNSSRVSASPAKQESDSSVEPQSRATEAETTKQLRTSAVPEPTTNGHSAPVNSTEANAIVEDIEKGDSDQINEAHQIIATHRKPTTQVPVDQLDSTDDDLPKPIPRRSSLASQSQQQALETSAGSLRQTSALPVQPTPDSRKDSRPADTPRESGWAAPRSSKRGGRGRGGAGVREPANGHQNNGGYPANYSPANFSPDLSSLYAGQPSPYQYPRGNHPYAHPINGRGGWNNRGGLRSQSIPIDNNFYQRVGYVPNGGPPHLAPINPYISNVYDSGSVPMTAFPYPTHMDAPYLIEMVIMQLDYYFSVDNLIKDTFLRKHMDSKGFVLLDVIANFNRVKHLTEDRELIKAACVHSDIIEIRVGEDGKERLRKEDGWQQFLIPIDQREKSAQNDGPEQLRQLDRSLLPSPPYRGLPPTGIQMGQHSRFERRSYDSLAYSMMNGPPPPYSPYGGIPEVMYGDGMNGEETRGRSARSPAFEIPLSPMSQTMDTTVNESATEPDAFMDSQVDVLTLVVKMSTQSLPSYHSLSSRTFSNGSIDSRTIMSETVKSPEGSSTDGASTIVNGNEMHLPPVPRRASPNKPRSNDRARKDSGPEVFWVKDQEGPLPNLPAGLTSEPYVQLRMKALDQRNHAATGNCPYDMDVLYQFWCHFLIRNFNHRMYTEFKTCAHEDVKRTNYTGIQNLAKFYAQSLSSPNPIRDLVVRDYVDLVRNEPPALQGTTFKQLRSAWRNGALNLKNRKKLADIVDEKMKEQMDRLEA